MKARSLAQILLLAAGILPLGCRAPGPSHPPEPGSTGADPTKDEVPLAALGGWNATLVLDQGPVGVWTVGVMDVFPQYGCPEIAALDDRGRFHALWSYSGKWTPVTTVHDGKWLGGLSQADVDPRIPGTEVYVGSQNGNVWQVTRQVEAFLDCRLVAQLAGHEVHTLVAGELDPRHPGGELLVFTRPGALFELRPRSDGLDGFASEHLQDLEGRIRDALILPGGEGAARIATVGRHGKVETLRIGPDRLEWRTVHEVPMGAGRLALRPPTPGQPLVLYSTCDDGRVYRHEERAPDSWSSELVYAGPQGMRGCCAGRFDADPSVETLAVFGYSKRVELLARHDGHWTAETLFVDTDKGHWLAAGELDGRNTTDELIASGYSGRIVLLARPPGYGLPPGVPAVAR
ncbi:MAG TPA: hypothetical protein VF530_17470 [Planctomycetota bacterium]